MYKVGSHFIILLLFLVLPSCNPRIINYDPAVKSTVLTPSAPTELEGAVGDTEVLLSWTAPSRTGVGSITDYVIRYSSNSGSSWTTFTDGISSSTSATVTGLTNGTAYIFQVAATNAAGTGSYSASSASVTPALDFVSTWNTDGPSWASGTSASNQIRLPLESSGNYNFRVQWGDGTENIITSWDDANKTHTYASLGSYTVRISGTITGFRFNTSGDRYKLINISQFGPLRLGNNGSYFAGLVHLTITATDPLDLTGTTNLSRAFAFCESLSTVPSMPYWDTSNVTNMSAMFQETYQFNEDIASWNTSNVTDMSWMFFYSENFDRAIGTWDTSKVTDMSYMFYYTGAFNQNIGSWNTANV
ncbi:MAG: BspA family leucine-rich repeat surface protein, partial [Proteobacteria bacterium]|nr:BspA family leucine-rich repeat surface protein [Pseudomonadota bacterium]